MKIETTRFGALEIDDESIITMPKGPLGFEDNTKFVTIQHREDTAFRWLQSVEEPSLAFVVVDPSRFMDNYDIEISDMDVEKLQLESDKDAFILAIARISDGGKQIALNLAAPIVINSRNMTGMQIVLQDNRYAVKHPLEAISSNTDAGTVEKVAA